MARDEEVDDGVAQELQALVAVGQLLVRGVGAVREGLPQKGPLPEIIALIMYKLRQKGRIRSMMMSRRVDFVSTVWF